MPESQPYIVVGADGSASSVMALRWAVAQAALTGAEVRVATAYSIPVTIYFVPTYTEAEYYEDAQAAMRATVDTADVGDQGVRITETIVEARPAQMLSSMAQGAELLVLGAQGQGMLPGMHLGSVSNYCVHHSPCPVVIVRAPES